MENVEKAPESTDTVDKKVSHKLDIETYCDIKGIHEGERFGLVSWYKEEKAKTLDEWEKVIKARN
jgi:hypothetical protein